MNKNHIQNANVRNTSNTYLKTEFNNMSQIKDNRFYTDPSPKKGNKENIVKASYLKTTLSNHLIKQERNITPTLPKSSQKQEEQIIEPKENICQAHKKKFKYEANDQMMCSRCVVDYAIQSGLPIHYCELDKKLLTFGQEEDHNEFQQFNQNISKDLLYIQNIQTQANGIIKKKELKDFIVKVGDVISQNMQFLKQIQQQDIQYNNTKQQTCKILEELQYMSKQIINDIFEKQNTNSQSLLINSGIQQVNLVSFKSIVSQQIKDLQNIKKDILENVENIITQMDLAPFKIIINKYNEKLKSFENSLFEIQDQYKQSPKQNEDKGYTKMMRDINFQKKLSKLLTDLIENPIKKSIQLTDSLNNNTKFIQLLQKVNTNQNTNTIFYKSILKDINSDEKPKQIKVNQKTRE